MNLSIREYRSRGSLFYQPKHTCIYMHNAHAHHVILWILCEIVSVHLNVTLHWTSIQSSSTRFRMLECLTFFTIFRLHFGSYINSMAFFPYSDAISLYHIHRAFGCCRLFFGYSLYSACAFIVATKGCWCCVFSIFLLFCSCFGQHFDLNVWNKRVPVCIFWLSDAFGLNQIASTVVVVVVDATATDRFQCLKGVYEHTHTLTMYAVRTV